MSKEIKEQPLPDFMVDFIGEQVSSHIGLNFLSTFDKNQSILLYSFISEQFCLMLQKRMIEERNSKAPEPLIRNKMPNFARETLFNTLHLFSKEHQIEEKTLKTYQTYLESFAVNLINFLLDRRGL